MKPISASNEPLAAPALRSVLTRRRIVFLLCNFDLGGAERQAILFARYLQQSLGARPQVWGFANNLEDASQRRAWKLALQYRVKTRSVPHSWGVRSPSRLFRLTRFSALLRAARPDLLLPYTTLPNVVCGLTWRAGGVQSCIWNQRDEGLGWPIPWCRRAAVQTPAFIANTARGRQFLLEEGAVDPSLVHVIPNALDPMPARDNRTTWRCRLGLADKQIVAVSVANLQSNKDHTTLLKAWRIMLDAVEPDAAGDPPVLLLAGYHGGTFPAIRALADELHLSQAVHFLGPIEDVTGLYAAADLGILSSRSEGLPNAVLEAMAAGLPVAGTDIPGIREALGIDGGHAAPTLSPAGDAAVMGRRLTQLVKDKTLREELGAQNRRRVDTVFAPGVVFPVMARVLANALQGRGNIDRPTDSMARAAATSTG
jgi:glycosyltransferase involved in cell wall biosynthesis